MSITKRFGIFLGLLVLISLNTRSQGCSDAGFCTLNTLAINAKLQKDSTWLKSNISVGASLGFGDDGNVILNPFINYQASFTKRISLSTKLAGTIVTGKQGFNANISDLYVTGNFVVFHNKANDLTLLGGIKVPLNYSDASYRSKQLPLSYQSSLATIDAIFGANFGTKYFDVSAGVQVPFFNGNRNKFFAYNADTIDFSSTNLFERKSDALLRATGHYTLRNGKWKFAASLLGIYHLGNDTYVNQSSQRLEIPKSSGLTLNGVIAVDYYFKRNQFLNLSVATPFIVRKIRPDGLTRSLVVAVEYHFLF